jgi:hypothetical protein
VRPQLPHGAGRTASNKGHLAKKDESAPEFEPQIRNRRFMTTLDCSGSCPWGVSSANQSISKWIEVTERESILPRLTKAWSALVGSTGGWSGTESVVSAIGSLTSRMALKTRAMVCSDMAMMALNWGYTT